MHTLSPAAKITADLSCRPPKVIQHRGKRSITNNQRIPFSTIHALSEAPFNASYTQHLAFLVSAEEFFEENHLISASIKPATQQKYGVALENFKKSRAACDPSALSLDQRLSIHIQETHLENDKPGKRQEMSNLICMLLLIYPHLRQDIGLARRCISGCRSLKPATSSAPFTKELVLALSWELIRQRRPQSAAILILSFAACLRVSEALNLEWKHVALPGDIRLAANGPSTAGINIRDAKTARQTGKYQFVQISDAEALQFLKAMWAALESRNGPSVQLSYQQYATDLQRALQSFSLQNQPFTSHSARISKATEDFIRHVPVEQIAINGRWKSINSLRHYVTNGRAWILDTKMTNDIQSRITRAANQLRALIREVPNTNQQGV